VNAVAQGDGWSWLQRVAAEPALLELLLVLAALAALWLVGLRLERVVTRLRGKSHLRDYLLGVEQALSGDPLGASKRLQRIVDEDPENHQARLLLAEALAELDELAAAHQHHVVLQSGFHFTSRRNDLALARCLLASGRPVEATEAARRALRAHPDDVAAWRLRLQAELAAGLPGDAAESGSKLLRLLPGGSERDAVAASVARAWAGAGLARLRAGDEGGARAALQRARAVAVEVSELALLDRRLLPSPAANALTVAELTTLNGGEPYRCRSCGGPLAAPLATCPHCTALLPAKASEPNLVRELGSASQLLDEIEENASYARSLLQQAIDGDADAEAELVESAPAAVDELLAAGSRLADPTPVVRVLQRCGPGILPSLFEAFVRCKERKLSNLGGLLGRGDARQTLIGRVVQGFGREALPQFEALWHSGDRDLRRLLIDFHLGLADQAELQSLLERCPPLEVVHRMNQAPVDVLVRLLTGVLPGSFLAGELLVQPAFSRDAELVAAIVRAPDPAALESVVLRRGPSRAVIRALLHEVAEGAGAELALRVLKGLGPSTLAHLVAAFCDPDGSVELRQRLRPLLLAFGSPIVAPLCDALGSEPSPTDDEVVAVLQGLGTAALPALADAYLRGGLLERLHVPGLHRYSHRRATIVAAIGSIGGPAARDTLEQLRAAETDTNLKLRIGQGLKRVLDTQAQGTHGQAG
jgi:tetratricopeptide (TPR) repeat protein